MSTPRDREELILNPVTGKLDMVRSFNVDRIVTSGYNAAGTPRVTYDIASHSFIDAQFEVVCDLNGNVVSI